MKLKSMMEKIKRNRKPILMGIFWALFVALIIFNAILFFLLDANSRKLEKSLQKCVDYAVENAYLKRDCGLIPKVLHAKYRKCLEEIGVPAKVVEEIEWRMGKGRRK